MVRLENPGMFTFNPRFFAVVPVISRNNFRKSAVVTYIPYNYLLPDMLSAHGSTYTAHEEPIPGTRYLVLYYCQ